MSDDPGLQLLADSPFGAVVVRADLEVLWLNACAARLLGVEVGAAVGQSFADLAQHPHGESGWRALFAGDGKAARSLPIVRADGGDLRCNWQHQRRGDATLVFLHDDSARADVDVKLRRQDQLLRTIVHSLDVVVWAVDLDGIFVYHEGKALETAGIPQGAFLGQDVFVLYADQAGNESIRGAMRGEFDHNINAVHGMSWENWYMPVRDEHGEIVGVAGLTMDITVAQRREQELQARLAVIEQQQQTIRALATPIIEVWDSVLCVPMVGITSPERAADTLDALLQAVTRTRARFAVLDLTGVESLDEATAGGLVALVRALKLLGAQGIVTGIHPAVAATIVGLDVDLSAITVHADLRSALRYCISRLAARGR